MKGRRADGSIRRSQVLTTAGPGALVDLVGDAVIIKGPDNWYYPTEQEGFIEEPRLARQALIALHRTEHWPRGHVRLRLPPVSDEDDASPNRGIHAREFPSWYLCQRCNSLVRRDALDEDRRHRCTDDPKEKAVPTVPVRFVGACRNGHLQDIAWRGFLHPRSVEEGVEKPYRCAIDPVANTFTAASGARYHADLQLRTEGTSGELTDLVLSCRRCGARRGLQDLSLKKVLGKCSAWRPWLSHNDEECEQELKMLIRTASNAWFPLNLSVIALPDDSKELQQIIDRHWRSLHKLVNRAKLEFALDGLLDDPLIEALQPYDLDEIVALIQKKAANRPEEEASLREAEWQALMTEPYGVSDALPPRGEDWFAMRVEPDQRTDFIDRVVLIPALKIVAAQVGFLRLEGFEADAEGGFTPEPARVAPLSERVDWIPAVEMRGEGIFIAFDEARLREWEARPAVVARTERFRRALQAHNLASGRLDVEFGGARLLLLHSLAHMLIRTISLECGYSAAAIRERIYCYRAPDVEGASSDAASLAASRAGILLYTGTPGSEGTLGGLVEVGRSIVRHLRTAVESNRLCSNDPICAQHVPGTVEEGRHREGAACHGCLLIAEPSCERMNRDLDRTFVVPTVDEGSDDVAFFASWVG
jgi:hypothetical protein